MGTESTQANTHLQALLLYLSRSLSLSRSHGHGLKLDPSLSVAGLILGFDYKKCSCKTRQARSLAAAAATASAFYLGWCASLALLVIDQSLAGWAFQRGPARLDANMYLVAGRETQAIWRLAPSPR